MADSEENFNEADEFDDDASDEDYETEEENDYTEGEESEEDAGALTPQGSPKSGDTGPYGQARQQHCLVTCPGRRLDCACGRPGTADAPAARLAAATGGSLNLAPHQAPVECLKHGRDTAAQLCSSSRMRGNARCPSVASNPMDPCSRHFVASRSRSSLRQRCLYAEDAVAEDLNNAQEWAGRTTLPVRLSAQVARLRHR